MGQGMLGQPQQISQSPRQFSICCFLECMLVMTAFTRFRGRIGSKASSFSLSLHTSLGNSSKTDWSGHPVQAGVHAVTVVGSQPEPQVVFNLFPPPYSLRVSKQACVRALHEQRRGFLQPSSESHSFSKQLRGLVFLESGPICALNLSFPREDP